MHTCEATTPRASTRPASELERTPPRAARKAARTCVCRSSPSSVGWRCRDPRSFKLMEASAQHFFFHRLHETQLCIPPSYPHECAVRGCGMHCFWRNRHRRRFDLTRNRSSRVCRHLSGRRLCGCDLLFFFSHTFLAYFFTLSLHSTRASCGRRPCHGPLDTIRNRPRQRNRNDGNHDDHNRHARIDAKGACQDPRSDDRPHTIH